MKTNLFSELTLKTAAPTISKVSYLSRLTRLWERMSENSVCILVSNPECTRSNDTHFPYRQSSEIVYLNGFPEPNSVLIVTKLDGKQNVIMLVQPKDKERETWDGIRYGVKGARDLFFAQQAYPVSDFEKVVGKLLASADAVYFRYGQNPAFDKRFKKVWKTKQITLLNPKQILDEMRLFKSDEELKIIRHACEISALAHKQAMMACSPGMPEYKLQAIVEFVFNANGAVAPAYTSIVASGNNACVLHYTENEDEIKDGDLVLIDAGAEFGTRNGGYAGDITRCFPANGKFTEPQRELYELVLKAQVAAIEAARPGARLIHVQQTAERVLRAGLKKLGILPANATAHSARSNPGALSLSDFLPHGTSHWMGIDVHDVGKSTDVNSKKKQAKRRLLEPGMVFTVEPGLYINKDDRRVPARYRGIGIRIEDDIVITASGNEVLTASVPKSVAEIEALMAKQS